MTVDAARPALPAQVTTAFWLRLAAATKYRRPVPRRTPPPAPVWPVDLAAAPWPVTSMRCPDLPAPSLDDT
ncbi:hypothetical protein GCM10010399_52770 [Dactylosporangium fulvum]|uniref:Uncharacterized protein n=1 Tax=Dactylosporangium fulvum TaxID=53359 RepID=A0ABY5VQH7_9ACTN|nr:hypothetical protein [Dactylosporangium fulvum]UWP79064.1 hypothetical protein Dfulv_28290 [Dactylosporangium fulvum]